MNHTTTTPTIDTHLLEGFLLNKEEHHTQSAPLAITGQYRSQPSMSGLLKDLHGGKTMSQKELIEDIEKLIIERQELQQELFGDINDALVSMNNFLSQVGSKIDAVEQLKLREKLLEIEMFKMQEKINAFRDIAALKRELRDRVAEFKERETRMSVIDELIED
jgi:hypothetical protein